MENNNKTERQETPQEKRLIDIISVNKQQQQQTDQTESAESGGYSWWVYPAGVIGGCVAGAGVYLVLSWLFGFIWSFFSGGGSSSAAATEEIVKELASKPAFQGLSRQALRETVQISTSELLKPVVKNIPK